MRIIYTRFLPALIVLWLFCSCARADSAGPTGFYYEDDLDHPLAGALIALYNADNNLLVDFTYTRSDGGFALKAPPTKGKYYVVATKDQFSQKVDFDYDPQTPAQNLLIQHHQPKSVIGTALIWIGGKLVEGINLLIGLLIGLWFKIYEDRKKARQVINREIKTVKDSTDEILRQYRNLRQSAQAYGESEAADAQGKQDQYLGIATTIGGQVKELLKKLEANTALEEAVYTARTLIGRNDYATFKRTLREIEKLTSEIVADPAKTLNQTPEVRDLKLKSFTDLEADKFLNS
ncbi:MAG TPA: hypothetical protein VGN86_08130 [Pyrinomonadaceae bacterium]|jgi:hypothetical protein|nr:hypothetical protein [Pyrinomonadaceae bacterium]